MNRQTQQSQTVPNFTWQQSLPLPWGDPRIFSIGGTEIRALVPFDGKLFAANGYWMDSEKNNPSLPGAQVLRLDSSGSAWRVDLELTDRNPQGLRLYQAISMLEKVRFTTDGASRPLVEPVDLLLASVWKRGSGLDIFSRSLGGQWTKIPIPVQYDTKRGFQVRAFSFHKDRTTGVDMVFAGASSAKVYSGTYDPGRRNIVWNPQSELQGAFDYDDANPKGRVSSFAECNGKLYAGAYDTIYERVDGTSPSWRKVFVTTINAKNERVTGLRGLTCVRSTSGSDVLFASVEDNPSRIYRIDPGQINPAGGYNAALDLDVSSFLTKALGTLATYAVVAYNDMTPYPGSSMSCPNLLMGFEVNTPRDTQSFDHRHHPDAHYLVRDCNGNYTMREVRDFGVNPKPQLMSVRTIALSPFASDPPGTIYAGGFDCNRNDVHNTAWLYKGVPTH